MRILDHVGVGLAPVLLLQLEIVPLGSSATSVVLDLVVHVVLCLLVCPAYHTIGRHRLLVVVDAQLLLELLAIIVDLDRGDLDVLRRCARPCCSG